MMDRKLSIKYHRVCIYDQPY